MRGYTLKATPPKKQYITDSQSVFFVETEFQEIFERTPFPQSATRKNIANLIAALLNIELGDLQEDTSWTCNIANNYFVELLEPGTYDVLCYLAIIDNMFDDYLVYLISNDQSYKTRTVTIGKKDY